MNAPSRTGSRVVIALDPYEPTELTLEIARYLLSDASAELLGLFVEDAHLLELAQSRLAREIAMSGRERPLDPVALQRQLRAQMGEMKRCFERAAGRLGLRHAFEVVRGEVVGELVRRSAKAEALVVGLGRGTAVRAWGGTAIHLLASAPLRAVLFAREGWLSGTRVLVAARGVGRGHAGLQAAIRVARASHSPLALLVPESSSTALEQLRAAAPEAEIESLIAVPDLTAATLARAVQHSDARLLILEAGEPKEDAQLVNQLLKATGSSLLLIREPP